MHDFSCSDPDEMIDSEIAINVRYYKETKEGVHTMCRIMDEIREEGKIEARITDISKIMESLNITLQQALDILQIPVEEQNLFVDAIK